MLVGGGRLRYRGMLPPYRGHPMTQDSSTYWKKSRVELRAAGFEPDRAAKTNAVVTIAAAYTNAHRCNNRVPSIADLLVEILAERGGQGLLGGAPAGADAPAH